MKLNKTLEIKVKNISLSYLRKGRPNFDVPHTLCAVFWMKKILKKENADEKCLLTAVYFHDVGYSCMFNKTADYEQVIKNKKTHMKRGSAIAKKELSRLKEYSNKEIVKISKFICNHDKLKEIKNREETLLMEADSLGMVDVIRIKPTFGAENWTKFYEDFKRLRVPLFKTKISKKFLTILLKKADRYYEKQMKLIKGPDKMA
ncbi:MAG: HD domain-containing protein [Nanoarchaeota archaeon]|nr:HD domain-containing protein [Nanoarchaeota archaeon]